ncbi:transposase [Moelleriella libera RCEF 2490]|uniref:Transposase n=1 Tax=Moelleriella libera RCEF 2490 TaxID=1081109 RepID=A0A166PDC6_9HYPO|nr:transposase [Moelleriella libera RCEF 2490]
MRQKKLHSNRQSSERVSIVLEYFEKLEKVITNEGIIPEDIWNMDETGFRIGIGKDQFIVTKRKRAHLFSMPENREAATAIEAISAGGLVIPTFLILKGQKHMESWYHVQELHPDTKITLSTTGYTNDEIGLAWLKHFNEQTIKTTIGSKRLLIFDGHGSHNTFEFINYCFDQRIIPFAMPPHLTHLLQPLDVVVFQPLKHYHAKALDTMVREGAVNISKLEFLSCIEGVRKQAFKKTTILSAFKRTGISPFNPHPIIEQIASRSAIRTPSPDNYQHSSSDFETPTTLRQMNKVADRLDQYLQDDDSLEPEFAYNIGRFIRGSLINATELIQTKRDLGRTRAAEEISKQRRAMKKRPLQSGGVLSVQDGRKMVFQKDKEEAERINRLINIARDKAENQRNKVIFEAAKKARKWRMDKRLDALEIYDGNGVKHLRRA